MDDISEDIESKIIKKYLKNTIHYTVNKKVNQYIDKLEHSIKLLENNLNLTNALFNYVKDKNSILEDKIKILTDLTNELKQNNKNNILDNISDNISDNIIYSQSIPKNIIIHKSNSFKNIENIGIIRSSNSHDNSEFSNKNVNDESDDDNENDKSNEILKHISEEIKPEIDIIHVGEKKNNKNNKNNKKIKTSINSINEYNDIKIQNFDLDSEFTKKCLHYCNIEGDLKLFKKMYIDDIPKEYYPIRHIKKKFQYWLDGHMNDDQNGSYIINTIIKNIEKIYLKINTFDNYVSDMDQFFKNQEHINSLSEQKYKDKFLLKIIQITNI